MSLLIWDAWCSFLCRDLKIFLLPPTLYCDNASSIFLAPNLVSLIRSKYIDTNYHYVKEIVKRGALVLGHVPSIDQLDNLFTKALGMDRFLKLIKKITICSCLNVLKFHNIDNPWYFILDDNSTYFSFSLFFCYNFYLVVFIGGSFFSLVCSLCLLQ